jgi:hypothetical protein
MEKRSEFSPEGLINMIDSFSDPLYNHLKEEPDMIVALAQYSTADIPIDIVTLALAGGKEQVSMSFLFNILPVFFLNLESVDFENGLWHDVFPPVNKPTSGS